MGLLAGLDLREEKEKKRLWPAGKSADKRKKERKKEKNILKYIKYFYILLARCLDTQNWLHNFGMQRKSPKVKQHQFLFKIK